MRLACAIQGMSVHICCHSGELCKDRFQMCNVFTIFTPRTLPFFTPLPSLSLLENYYLSIEININLKEKRMQLRSDNSWGWAYSTVGESFTWQAQIPGFSATYHICTTQIH